MFRFCHNHGVTCFILTGLIALSWLMFFACSSLMGKLDYYLYSHDVFVPTLPYFTLKNNVQGSELKSFVAYSAYFQFYQMFKHLVTPFYI